MHESDFDGRKYTKQKQEEYRVLKFAAACSPIGVLLLVLGGLS